MGNKSQLQYRVVETSSSVFPVVVSVKNTILFVKRDFRVFLYMCYLELAHNLQA